MIRQVYPRSLQNPNQDGVGDSSGIRSRLEYLDELGVDALRNSPEFPSTMCDFGYDNPDYRDVDSVFGTLGDYDQ